MARRWIEIRSYNLKPGTRQAFHDLFTREALPMLARWKVEVVCAGGSPHDDVSYFLIRAYDSVAHRDSSQDAFYGSDEWRKGPREAILAFIESYTSVMLEVDEATLQDLRRTGSGSRDLS
ncbi:NIPSNAP family protein [Corallococcus sp. EGB]|uniref:NIPSNAP family protein n=1 Tax=Corallococcus sp. EGB TaxID=1521117 RepID=UPI001CBAC830|nr:NIPSNAP family protein [Corallococcus sp. EGB]